MKHFSCISQILFFTCILFPLHAGASGTMAANSWQAKIEGTSSSSYINESGERLYSSAVTEVMVDLEYAEKIFAQAWFQTGGLELQGSDDLAETATFSLGGKGKFSDFSMLLAVDYMKRSPHGREGDLWGPRLRGEYPAGQTLVFSEFRLRKSVKNTEETTVPEGVIVSGGVQLASKVGIGNIIQSIAVTHDDGVYLVQGKTDSNGTFLDYNGSYNYPVSQQTIPGNWMISPNLRGILGFADKESDIVVGLTLSAKTGTNAQ